jgi:hypothetical protein
LVERYDGDGQDDFKELNVPIKYWEISNEPEMQMPNLQFWFGDAKTYTPFLLATSKKIKEVCPSCQILPGGMANTSEQSKKFFKDVFADAGIGQAIDITNIHFISNGEDLASLNVKTFKSFIEQFKLLQKPLWVTEAETIIDSDPTKNEEQLIKSTLDALSLGTTKIFYTRQDFEKQANSAPFPPGQSGLPILKTKTTPPKKEVSKVYLTLINKLNYFDSVQKLAEGQYKFKVGSKTIYFIWKGTLPYELTGKISVTDLYGTEKTIDCATFQTSSKGEYIE